MSHRDTKPDDEPAASGAARQETDLVPSEQEFQVDLEAGPILAELLSSGVAPSTAGDDIHAAVASLSEDAITELDPTAQHLTQSVDLFDVPAGDDVA